MKRTNPRDRQGRVQLIGEVAVLFAVAVAAVIYVLHTINNQINVPINDDWRTVELYVLLRTHRLSAGQVWAQWNENRMALPFLVTLGVDYFSNMDMRWLIDLGLAIQLCSAGIIWWIARRLKLPIAIRIVLPFLALPLAAYEDYLWGFQLAWITVYFFVVLSIALTLCSKRRWTTVACICICTAASFTSLQGLLLWVVIIILGAALGWGKRELLMVVASWVVVTILYFIDFNFSDGSSPGGLAFALRHPELVARYVVHLFGSLFDPTRMLLSGTITSGVDRISPYLGVLVVVIAVVLVIFGSRALLVERRKEGADFGGKTMRLAVGIGLLVYTLLFACVTSVGRVGNGVAQASASRYTLYTSMLLMGIIITTSGLKAGTQSNPAASVKHGAVWREWVGIPSRYRKFQGAMMLALCVLLIMVGIANSAWDPVVRTERLAALRVIEHVPDKPSAQEAYSARITQYVTLDAPTVEWLVPMLRKLHTSQFPAPR